ncbi:UDP-glycosyltransferase 76F1 [Hibiscus trionum]|uniref:UDP-glycosyltransferase 76F1 n=1 Tax=Hibiscus trionum TaxID=183268 RepID=A0A9W7HZ94_HIBTR|nr:UDP-glycosyltransferase 76F1 [Hibiscus trionum]
MERQISNSGMEQRKGRRLVLFPLPLQGHINPMLDLANILHSRGFSITIVHTSFNSPEPSNYPHFAFRFISENLPEDRRACCKTDLIAFLLTLNEECGPPFRDCLADLLSDSSEEPIACLISDAILYFTQDVAHELKVPRLVLRTGAASSFCVFSAFPLLREKGYLPIQDSQLEEPVVELPPLRVKDLPSIHTNDPEDLYKVVTSMVNQSKASSGMIWNTFQELEQAALETLHQQLGVPLFPIGPFHKRFAATSSPCSSLPHDETCLSWLDKQVPQSVVYVGFGSLAIISETQFLEIAWGLANSNQPFLWVVRPGLIRGSDWLESLPDGFLEALGGRGHIVKWAPQQQVLAHPSVGAFWTHNGWNSTLESICEGVPMICMPCFTDQRVNARYVSEVWGIGLQLEKGLERGEIERTIKRLMVKKGGENIRERVSCLKKKSYACLSRDGSSKQSLDDLVRHISSLESLTFHTY